MNVVTESVSSETTFQRYERVARSLRERMDFLDSVGATRMIPWQIRYAQKYMGPIIDALFEPPQLQKGN